MRVELGIADHIWLDKRVGISQTIDALGEEFKPAMRAGWMAYIRKAYPDGPADGGLAIGQDPLVLDAWAVPARGFVYSLIPKRGCACWTVFCNEYAPKSEFRFLK